MQTENEALEWASQMYSRTALFGARRRRAACRKLIDLGTAQAVPFLVSALSSTDEELRRMAEDGLKTSSDPEAIDALLLGYLFTKSDVLLGILKQLGREVPPAMDTGATEPSAAEKAWRTENQRDGTTMAFIPGGPFMAGEERFPVDLGPCYFALTRVTNLQFARFLSERKPDSAQESAWIVIGTSSPIRKEDGEYVVDPENGDLPAAQVRWEGAAAYCEWAGLRLPTELEWEKGARGVDGRLYPWGDTWEDGRPRPAGGDRHAEEITPVRAHPQARSPYGLYEMIGGLYEWTGDWYDESAYERYKQGDLKPPATGENRVLRGGPWLFGTPVYRRTEFRRETVWRGGTMLCGFRCAKDL